MNSRLVLRSSISSILGAICGTFLALQFVHNAAAAVNTGIYTGYASSCDSWRYDPWNPGGLAVLQNHYCWHFDEAPPNQWHGALDLHRNLGLGYPGHVGDDQQDVYWIQATTSQSLAVTVRFEVLSGSCTGVRVVLTGGSVGKFHYKHINPASGINGSTWQNWYTFPTSVQGDRWVGRTSSAQPGCPWFGPHLHQSGDVSSSTDIWRRNPSYVDCGGPLYCWSGPAFNVTW